MAPQKISLEDRFWSKVDKSAGPQGCWVWTGSIATNGYGLFTVNDRTRRAHRVSFRLFHGYESPLLVCHHCDNPPCVNPAHLFEGTKSDNGLDMSAKGRSPFQQRTHCPQGHPYSSQNTYFKGRARECRACGAARARARYHRPAAPEAT